MNTYIIFAAAFLTVSGLACGPSKKPPDAAIAVEVARPGPALSSSMYGIFFEDLNHAADGSLCGELIQNRDFEYNRPPEGMSGIDDSTVVNPKGWRERYRRPADLHAWSPIREHGATG